MKKLRKKDINKDPFVQFDQWYREAFYAGVPDPSVMNLATSSAKGKPSSRIVLLKNHDRNGFVFFTNFESRKGKELIENPFAALTFYWQEMERQIRIEGKVRLLSGEKSDEYFASRPVESQISASISPQSKVISCRTFLDERFLQFKKKLKDKEIQRPESWGGFLLKPDQFEFWQGGAYRLHDRISYVWDSTKWTISRLAP